MDNPYFQFHVDGYRLLVVNRQLNETLEFNWPGVAASLSGRLHKPLEIVSGVIGDQESFFQDFKSEDLFWRVSIVQNARGPWFHKQVSIQKNRDLPTPDYVEVDRQKLPCCQMRVCGYIATAGVDSPVVEEEGCGVVPGCGYPLMGEKHFTGLEHPVAFNIIRENEYYLRHYPVWYDNTLESIPAVFGWGRDSGKTFEKYLDSIRLPILEKPLISFCTFWTDPYLGNGEYDVSLSTCKKFIDGHSRLGLRPDIFTFDAGWNNRYSIFHAKESLDGDDGLRELKSKAVENGSDLSLWVSHNGIMGISPEYMEQCGFQTGSGQGASYCGDGFGVMMDEAFQKALLERFSELVTSVGVCHLKIDWDNECAVNPEFAVKYLTENHVRQASLNVFFNIARHLRQLDLNIVIRNGWWPSPWWLMTANHVWLSDSGDSECASLPSATQRDSATTHRDIMYYNILRRDRTPLPLDCFDNHEFPQAPRNPFLDTPASWANAIWWSFFRGSTYLAYSLSPDSISQWQADYLSDVMDFCRINSKNIFVKYGKMILGNPGQGEVYGFLQPGEDESWCALRNPLPIPQKIAVGYSELAQRKICRIMQFYPYSDIFGEKDEMVFHAHEVKLLILQHRPNVDNSEKLDPLIPEYDCTILSRQAIGDVERVILKISMPPQATEVTIKLKMLVGTQLMALCSRYSDAKSQYSLPVTSFTASPQGYGEKRNQTRVDFSSDAFASIQIPSGGTCYVTIEAMLDSANSSINELWICGYVPLQFLRIEPVTVKGTQVPAHPLGRPFVYRLL